MSIEQFMAECGKRTPGSNALLVVPSEDRVAWMKALESPADPKFKVAGWYSMLANRPISLIGVIFPESVGGRELDYLRIIMMRLDSQEAYARGLQVVTV